MESDAQIFTIGLHEGPRTEEERQGPGLMEALAHASGGINYAVYDMGRLLTVQVLAPMGVPELHVFARPGYYTPQN